MKRNARVTNTNDELLKAAIALNQALFDARWYDAPQGVVDATLALRKAIHKIEDGKTCYQEGTNCAERGAWGSCVHTVVFAALRRPTVLS